MDNCCLQSFLSFPSLNSMEVCFLNDKNWLHKAACLSLCVTLAPQSGLDLIMSLSQSQDRFFFFLFFFLPAGL